MKQFIFCLGLLCLLTSSSCLQQECRDCEGFNYDGTAFNPDFAERDLVFRNIATNEESTFEFIRLTATPDQQVCSGEVDDIAEIPCVTGGSSAFRNADLGFDMSLSFEENDQFSAGSIDQVIMTFEFKGMEINQFTRTHAMSIEPTLAFQEGVVVALDTLTLGGVLFEDVIDLRQEAEAFLPVSDRIPAAGRFRNIYVKQGLGIIGLRDLDDTVHLRLN